MKSVYPKLQRMMGLRHKVDQVYRVNNGGVITWAFRAYNGGQTIVDTKTLLSEVKFKAAMVKSGFPYSLSHTEAGWEACVNEVVRVADDIYPWTD